MKSKKKTFIDTNVWLYLLGSKEINYKYQIARQLITENDTFLSIQVINETLSNLLSGKKPELKKLDEEAIKEILHYFFSSPRFLVEMNKETYLKASELRTKSQFSYWDSLIVAAALFSGSEILYSEDMHDGLVVEQSLKIINPFKASQ